MINLTSKYELDLEKSLGEDPLGDHSVQVSQKSGWHCGMSSNSCELLRRHCISSSLFQLMKVAGVRLARPEVPVQYEFWIFFYVGSYQRGPCLFHQDTIKPHSAHITTSLLHFKPACGPDLPPTRNTWHQMQLRDIFFSPVFNYQELFSSILRPLQRGGLKKKWRNTVVNMALSHFLKTFYFDHI